MMTRRKSVCSKWTLVLLVVILCPYVYSRPQETSSIVTSISKSENVETTENPIRYRYRNASISFDSYKLPLVTNVINISNVQDIFDENLTTSEVVYPPDILSNKRNSSNITTVRLGRFIRNKIVRNANNKNNKKAQPNKITTHTKFEDEVPMAHKKKAEIRRVITKWTDNTRYEDLDFSYETTTSDENGNKFSIVDNSEDFTSTESTNEISTADTKKMSPQPVNQLLNKLKHKIHKHSKPKQDFPKVMHVQSDNIHVTGTYSYPTQRPMYIFTTPTPTPIITNVGNPMPWPQTSNIHATYPHPNIQTIYHTPTTQRPVVVTKPFKDHYNHHHSVHNHPHHPGHEFEVTTFQPPNNYADRIVIRPEEYAASPDECPTIFLTLNNTFQGQGKEACPDLNIAVNTNVINKNVVVESDEEEIADDGLFTDPFGLPFGESADESANTEHHGYDSEENQEQVESASIEGLALTNYNAASDGDSPEAGGYGSPSSVLSSIHKPGRPHHDDEDSFSFSSIVQFFKPAINALGWLATINPLSFGLFSVFLAPIVFIFAGTSGIAALFAPWAFSAREAPKVVHVYRPHWHWDDEIKTWHLHSFPHTRKWSPRLPRSSKEDNTNIGSVKPTIFYKLKEWMKSATQRLRQGSNSKRSNTENRKNKRKKRETWAIRIK